MLLGLSSFRKLGVAFTERIAGKKKFYHYKEMQNTEDVGLTED